MGLDIVPLVRADDERISFSYGGFHEFRKDIAAHIGIDLMQMKGFGGEERAWPDPKDEPLVYLLHHSDCDGQLGYTECEAIAPRLAEIAPKIWDEDDPTAFIGLFHREKAEALVEAMNGVVEGKYEALDFS